MAKKKTSKKSRGRKAAAADSLPNAELDVLACLWQEGEATARRVRDMMSRYRPMAHGSVVTLLSRLEEKGMVAKRKGPVGKAFLFRSSRPPEPTYRKLTKDLLSRVFAGDPVTMLQSMVEAQSPTPQQRSEMQKVITGARGRARARA